MTKEISKNITNIITKLKDFFKVRTDQELADRLGVGQSTVSNWKSRGQINFQIIFDKIQDIDLNWLLYDEEVEPGKSYNKIQSAERIIEDEKAQYLSGTEFKKLLDIEVYDIPAYMSETGLSPIEEYPHSTKKLYLGMDIDPKRTKAIRVLGNSMEGSGIRAMDYVLYSTNDKAYHNREVLANLNGSLIVKQYREEGEKKLLYSNYSDETRPIEVGEQDELKIIGIVVAVLSYR